MMLQFPANLPCLRAYCFGGGGGGGSSSSGNTSTTTTANYSGAAGEGTSIQGSSNVLNLSSLSPAEIKDLTDFASGVVNSSLSSNATNVQTLLSGNTDVLKAVTALAKKNADLVTSGQNFSAATEAQIGQITSGALQTIAGLAQATSPQGSVTDTSKYLLYVGLAAAGAFVLIAIYGGRR